MIKGPRIIHFNIGGVHHDVAEATIMSRPDTTLAMLVRNHNSDEPLFIDLDGNLFRYILYYYRHGYLPTHEEVGISVDMWNTYIDWFALTSTEEEPENEEQPVDDRPEKIRKLQAAVDAQLTAIDTQKEKRQEVFAEILEWMCSSGQSKFMFVSRKDNVGIPVPVGMSHMVGNVSVRWLSYYMKEFIDFAKKSKLIVTVSNVINSKRKTFPYSPASLLQANYAGREILLLECTLLYQQ